LSYWWIQEFEKGRVSQAYNRGLGALLPLGSRGKAPGRGGQEALPPEAERIFIFIVNG